MYAFQLFIFMGLNDGVEMVMKLRPQAELGGLVCTACGDFSSTDGLPTIYFLSSFYSITHVHTYYLIF